MNGAMAPELAAVTAQNRGVAIDTGLRVPFKVYWFKLLHPLLERRGWFMLQGRQHRRYFVMPGDYVSGYTAKFGSFEAEEIAVARQVCLNGLGVERLARSALVDLGCHIGNYSVELGPDFGRVVAVDAVQSYAHVARANLAWNGLEARATVVCAAISDREGTVSVHMERQGNLGHAWVSRGPDDMLTHDAVSVSSTTLDALVAQLAIVDVSFIKFDIEGHEVAALAGARETIGRHAPVVQVEVDKGNLPAVLECVRQSGVVYEAWQVVRGDPARRGGWSRLWAALRSGGNPVFVQRLDGDVTNARHLPSVLLVPATLKIDWQGLFPLPSRALAPLPAPVPCASSMGAQSAGAHPLEDVTAVVVTFNSAHCVEYMARSLASWPHVIVVDNGSNDGTQAQVKRHMPHARWIGLEGNHGFGAANNMALAQVDTPYALLLNPDCLVKTQDAQMLLETARRWPQAAVIVPQLVDARGRVQLNYGWPRMLWTARGGAAQGPLCVGNACGAVMLLRLDALPTREWFDTRFFLYYEDEDLCLRLFQARLPVMVEPAVRVVHVNRGSVRGRRPLQVEYLRGMHHAMSKILFTAKHEGEAAARKQRRLARLQAVAVLVLRTLLLSPRHLARAWGRVAGFWRAPVHY